MKGSGPVRVEQAADELAERVVERVSIYVTEKTALLKQQVAVSEGQLAAVEARIARAQEQQDQLLGNQSLPPVERLLLSQNLNAVITTADARRTSLQDDLFEARQLLNLAESVESSRVVEPAAASKTTARSSRTSLLVGALIGLLVGAIAALAADPIAARRRGAAAAAPDARGKRVAVVVPAFDEERLVAGTIRGIPEIVDRIYVVDDASRDGTTAQAEAVGDPRVELIRHERNSGVGAAIATGYRRALEEEIDVVCVMAADNQMDPEELQSLVEPVARGEVEYAKANRLVSGEAWNVIPRTRYLGNAVLSLMTKIASGYWHVADSQAGYTALSSSALQRLDLDRLYPRYGFPNDVLVHLNVQNARVRDVPRGRSTTSASSRESGCARSCRGSPGSSSRPSGGGWARSTSSATSTRSCSSTPSAC